LKNIDTVVGEKSPRFAQQHNHNADGC